MSSSAVQIQNCRRAHAVEHDAGGVERRAATFVEHLVRANRPRTSDRAPGPRSAARRAGCGWTARSSWRPRRGRGTTRRSTSSSRAEVVRERLGERRGRELRHDVRPAVPIVVTPASDDVFTMWMSPSPACSCSSRRGTNDLMPWSTPQKLTRMTQSQSASVRCHEMPGLEDTGVVVQQVDRAEAVEGGVGERVDRGGVADVGRDPEHLGAGVLDEGDGLGEGRLLDVGDDHVHPAPRRRTAPCPRPRPLPAPVMTAIFRRPEARSISALRALTLEC